MSEVVAADDVDGVNAMINWSCSLLMLYHLPTLVNGWINGRMEDRCIPVWMDDYLFVSCLEYACSFQNLIKESVFF